MSARNRRPAKQLRRLRKALRAGRLPARVDLIDWLQLHGYAQTAGDAARIVLAERVRHESHVLGFKSIGDQVVMDCFAPGHVRGEIVVLPE